MQIQDTAETRAVLTGTVTKVINHPDGERVEIALDAADELFREIRVPRQQIPFAPGERLTIIVLSAAKNGQPRF
jgi:hypothetical protein